MSLLPEAGGETAVREAQDTEQSNHRGSPPPALVCRIARAGVLAGSVPEKRFPRPRLFRIAKMLLIKIDFKALPIDPYTLCPNVQILKRS
jgi:hypothetical protein